MALTHIEYGSVAKSDTINNNFSYLNDRITEINDTLTTTINSLSSNISAVNASLNQLSESFNSSLETLDGKIEEYKTKTKLLVNKALNIPNWSGLTTAEGSNDTYTAPANGFYLLILSGESRSAIALNGNSINSNNTGLIIIPVKSGDVLTAAESAYDVYFTYSAAVSIDNF